MKRRVLGLAVLGILIGAWLGVHHLSSRLIVPKRKKLESHHLKVLADPSNYGLEIQQLPVVGARGAIIDAVWVTACSQPGEAIKFRRMRRRLGIEEESQLEARGTIVLLHGRNGCKEDYLFIAERFCAAGFNCLLMDNRAHGRSEGRFCTFGRLERVDASAAIDAALEKFGPSIEPIGLWGLSLGGAIALQTAEQDDRVEAVVVVNTFANVGDIVVQNGVRYAGQFGVGIASLVMIESSRRSNANLFQARPEAAAAQLTIPTMVVHASDDEFIPATHGQRIYERLAGEKIHQVVPNADHWTVLLRGGDDLYQEMIEYFLDEFEG
ncbi:MAG: alpha/beta fold hydrolase [Verrucomicrobiota bacterium]